MRLKDLQEGHNIDDGIYVVDGEEGDPRSLIVGGPYPKDDAGRLVAAQIAQQVAARTGRPACTVNVTSLPRD